MKITITNLLTSLNDRISSFEPIALDEIDYAEYLKLSDSGFITTDKWILRLEKKTIKNETVYSVLPVSTYVKIKYCQQDIITKGRTYCVELFNGNNNAEVILGSEILTAQGVKALLAHGCLYDENKVRCLLKYLSNSAYHAPVRNVHSRLGWLWNGEEPIFLANKAISRSEFESSYIGQIDIEPKGSLDSWLEMVKVEIVGNTAAEICMIIGFASIILGYLNHFTDLGCLLFNLCNTSSKGKTTLALLSASVCGNPSLDKGVVTTLNSTQNALVAFVAQADSHTVALDECGAGDSGSFRKTMYQLATGRDRMRLNTDGRIRDSNCFNSCIICTSEFPIVDSTAPNGIRARVFEITDTLTTSAENADNIKKCVYQNYGYAGTEFVRFIMQDKLDTILDDYDKCRKNLSSCGDKFGITPGELTERVYSKLAIVLLTAKYVNQFFELGINLKAIAKYLLKLEQSIQTQADVAEKALDLILQYVSIHNNHFLYGNDTGQYPSSCVEGKIKNYSGYKDIIVLKVVVDKLLFDNGFENPRAIYGKLIEKTLLLPAKDRPEKKVRLIMNLPGQPCLTFRIPEE